MLEKIKVFWVLFEFLKLKNISTIFNYQVEEAGGKALACPVDIRDEAAVNASIEETVKTFGGIDIVINNASAISLTGTEVSDFYDAKSKIFNIILL